MMRGGEPGGQAQGPSLGLPRRVLRSRLVHNVVSLYAVQGASFVLPLLTLPYLARVLRPEGWGLVVFSQSFAGWVLLLLNYGFSFSATRAVARHRGDRAELARTVAGVQGAKLLLCLGALAVAAVAAFAVPLFRANPLYLLWGLAFAVANGLAPLWYFQGVERLRGPAALDVGTRVLATAAVFAWVRAPHDGWRVLAFQAVACALSGAISTAWMYRETAFVRPRLRSALDTLRGGWALFVFCGAASVYTTASGFVLGLLAPAAQVSFYGAGERAARAAVMLITPLSQALYPRISHAVGRDAGHADEVARRTLLPFTALGVVLAVAAVAAAPFFAGRVLGPGYDDVVTVVRVLACLPVLVAVGTVLGLHWALPLGMEAAYTRLVIAAGAASLLLAALLVPRMGAVGMAWSAVSAEALVEAGLVWLFLRRVAHPPAPLAVRPEGAP